MAVNKSYSAEERYELVSRLTYAAANLSDNKPDDPIHLTDSKPDVVYDPDMDFYKAKSVHTLVGELSVVEETDSMREHQEGLLEAAQRYESKVGVRDASLSTGIHMKTQYDWNDVLEEADSVRKRYTPRESSDLITMENGLRTFETAQPRVEEWLSLLPATSPCAARLCGGLKMILAVRWELMTTSLTNCSPDYLAFRDTVCANLQRIEANTVNNLASTWINASL